MPSSQRDTHSTVWHAGGLPPWEGLVGMWAGGLQAGWSRWQNGPLACSRNRVSHGLRSPRPPGVLGALSSGAPGWGTREGGAGGQQVLCSQAAWAGPHLHRWLPE